MSLIVMGIETSCDETSVAILHDDTLISNITATQDVHASYGVVPELASRAHTQNIIPVIHTALQYANLHKKDVNVVAFTLGPGLVGSLMVGISFAKSFAQALNLPIVAIDHLYAHVFASFIQFPNEKHEVPSFPFLCLTASGGHTQLLRVKDFTDIEIIGQTIDDAAGEAFDKAAKILGLPYPGGPLIDELAKKGNPFYFSFPKPKVADFQFSFSGLKTSLLYLVRDNLKDDPGFINKYKEHLAASYQRTIIEILTEKTFKAAETFGFKNIVLAGGVSANSELRKTFIDKGKELGYKIYIPPLSLTTDNGAMIAFLGKILYERGITSSLDVKQYATGEKYKKYHSKG